MTQPRPDNDRSEPRAAAAASEDESGTPKPRAALFGGESAQRAVYVISVAAELAGVHPQTLRVYERKGLVDPSRTGGGNRRYSQRDIERLRHIGMLTGSGMNLQGVRQVLELEAEVERLTTELERVRTEARDAVEQTHRKYRRDLVPLRQALVFRRTGTGDAPRRGGS
jgi:MerR family transcriptional regulator/heat shock protein HspR